MAWHVYDSGSEPEKKQCVDEDATHPTAHSVELKLLVKIKEI